MGNKSLYDKALSSVKKRDYRGAIKYLNQLIELNPKNADAYSERGVSKFHLKDLDGALADMNKSLELDPQNAYRYASRAYILEQRGDTLGAIEDYKKSIELDPENAVSHNNLGLLEDKLGYLEQSKKRLKLADEISRNEGEFIPESPENAVGELLNELNIEVSERQKKKISIWNYIFAVFVSKRYLKEYLSYVKSIFQRKSNK